MQWIHASKFVRNFAIVVGTYSFGIFILKITCAIILIELGGEYINIPFAYLVIM